MGSVRVAHVLVSVGDQPQLFQAIEYAQLAAPHLPGDFCRGGTRLKQLGDLRLLLGEPGGAAVALAGGRAAQAQLLAAGQAHGVQPQSDVVRRAVQLRGDGLGRESLRKGLAQEFVLLVRPDLPAALTARAPKPQRLAAAQSQRVQAHLDVVLAALKLRADGRGGQPLRKGLAQEFVLLARPAQTVVRAALPGAPGRLLRVSKRLYRQRQRAQHHRVAVGRVVCQQLAGGRVHARDQPLQQLAGLLIVHAFPSLAVFSSASIIPHPGGLGNGGHSLPKKRKEVTCRTGARY